MHMNSLEFAAIHEEEMEDGDDMGEMDVTGNSALDKLGEAEQV